MKKIWLGIGAAVIVVLLLLQTRFIEYMVLDDSGYAIPSIAVKQMLMADIDEKPETLEVPYLRFEVLEHIFKRGNLFYMGEKKKNQVNLAYPLYINDCAGIYFVSDSGSLFDEEFEQQRVYTGLRVQNRVAYNPGGERADAADYLFASIGDGLFINLTGVSYMDRGDKRSIAANSVIYFTEEYFTYCEPENGVGHFQVCRNVSDLKVQLNGQEYTYRELLLKLQVIFEKKVKPEREKPKKDEVELEVPEIEEASDDTLTADPSIGDNVAETVAPAQTTTVRRKRPSGNTQAAPPAPRPAAPSPGKQTSSTKRPHPGGGNSGGNNNNTSMGVRPDEMRPDKKPSDGGSDVTGGDSAPIGYVKPTVKVTGTSAGVYRLMIDVNVNDPARRLHPKRRVQFEFYEQLGSGKEQLAYRTYTGSSGTVTAGNGAIKPGTSYRVKVYFTYFDEKDDTIVEDVYEGTMTTAGFETLQPINLEDINIDVYYDNYILLPRVRYADGSDEEAVYGIDSTAGITLIIDGVTDPKFKSESIVDVNAIRSFKKHIGAEISSPRTLPAKSDFKYTLIAKDFFGKQLTLTNNTGTAKTCKSRPTGKVELKKNIIGDVELAVTLRDDDTTARTNADGDYEIYLVLSTVKFGTNDTQESIREICLGTDDKDGVRPKDVFCFKSDGVYCLEKDADGNLIKIQDALGNDAEGYDTSSGGLKINDSILKLDKLLLNTRYTAYLFSRFDLDNKKGVQEFGEIANFSFTSASLNSLGRIIVKTDVTNITAHSAVIAYELNVGRTNPTLREMLSDVAFDIVRTNGEEEVVDATIEFKDDDTAMIMFTGMLFGKEPTQEELFNKGYAVSDGDVLVGIDVNKIPGAVLMDASYFVEDADKGTHQLKSKTDYKIVPRIFATYDGEKYPMDVTLSVETFTTMKEPARVEVTNVLLGAEHLIFDSKVIDEDESIIGNSGHKVIVNIYQDNGRFVSAQRILKNTEEPEHIDLSNIDTDRNYKITYIAQEYNEGYNNATYEPNKVIAEVLVTDSVRLSGDIKLLELESSYRADLKVDMYDIDRNLINIPYYVSVEEVVQAATEDTAEVRKDVTADTRVTPKEMTESDRIDRVLDADGNPTGENKKTKVFTWKDADDYTANPYAPEEGGRWTVPQEMYPDSSYENRNNKYPLHFEPSYDLKKNKTYVFTLYTIISNQKLVMDTLTFSTEAAIEKISKPEEFVWKIKDHPDHRFVVSEDIELRALQEYIRPGAVGTEKDVVDEGGNPLTDADGNTVKDIIYNANDKQTALNITSIFSGQLNFQGYTLDFEMDSGTQYDAGLFNNLSDSAEIFDAVFDFHGPSQEHESGFSYWNCSGGLADRNYGHVHDIEINYRGGGSYQNTDFGLLFRWNTVSGIIENFAVGNVPDEGTNGFTAYKTCGLLCGTNYGTIRNGYIFGEDIFTDTSNYSVGGQLNVGGICGVASTTSKIENVFSLVNIIVADPSRSESKTAYNTYYGAIVGSDSGHTRNAFIVGLSTFTEPYNGLDYNNTNANTGPAVANHTVKTSRVYYYNDKGVRFKTHTKQIQIGLTTLYDYGWHKQILGDQFIVSNVEVGYYPHVKLSSELPTQEYIPLPERQSKATVDFMSAELVSYQGADEDSALIKFRFYNPQSVDITGITIDGLTVDIDRNTIVSEDGYTDLYATVSKPVKYVSSYEIKSVTYNRNGKDNTVAFDPAPFLLVDFYRPIYTANDWVNYVVKKPSENAKLRTNIDFSKMLKNEMRVTSEYTGKLNGNGYSLNNITISNSNLFAKIGYDGSITNMYIRNYKSGSETSPTTSTGVIHENYGDISNVHVRGIELIGYQYLGGLVNISRSGSVITDTSLKNVTLTYQEPTRCATRGYIGGISAYVENVSIQNCYVQDVTIKATDMADCGGAGGVAGYVTGGFLDAIYATGSMEVRGSYVGGIVGYFSFSGLNSGLRSAFSGVSVESYQSYLGGVVGYINETEMMTRDTNLSAVALANVLSNNPDAVGISYAVGWCPSGVSVWPRFNGTETQSMNGILLKYQKDQFKLDADGNETKTPMLSDNEKNYYTIMTTEQMVDPSYYKDTMRMRSYDFDRTADGYMPWLYTVDGKSLLPDQENIYLSGYFDPDRKCPIEIKNIAVNKATNIITLRYTSENGEIMSNGTIADLEMTGEGPTDYTTEWIKFGYKIENQQKRWKDSYMLTKIEYYADDPNNKKTADISWNPVRIPLTLYLEIPDSSAWANYIKAPTYGNYDNYIVTKDISFAGMATTTNVRLGRLVGGNTSGKTTITGLRLGTENFIYRINSELGNLIFNNCTVNSQGIECAGLVGLCAADVHDMEFNSISIDSNHNYTGIIGKQLGGRVSKIKLSDIKINNALTVSGDKYVSVGALIGLADSEAKLQEIEAENLNVYGRAYVGGVIGRAANAQINYDNMNGGKTHTKIVVRDAIVTGVNDQVGGVIGYYSGGWRWPIATYGLEIYGTPVYKKDGAGNDETDVRGHKTIIGSSTVVSTRGSYVGGIGGLMYEVDNGASDSPNVVDGIIVQGNYSYTGGAFGYAYHINDTTVRNTLVRNTRPVEGAKGISEVNPTYGYGYVGGVIGYINAQMARCYVENVTIDMQNARVVGLLAGDNVGNGDIYDSYAFESELKLKKANGVDCYEVGGITGWSNRQIYRCGVKNCNIVAEGYRIVGGIVGTMHSHVTRCYFYAEPIEANPQSPNADPAANTNYVIKGANWVGGLTGQQYNNYTQVSYSNANVIATGTGAGGFIGYFRNSYTSSGSRITGYSSAGLNNCYFVGTVEAASEAGGALGRVTMATDGAVDIKHQDRGGRINTAVETTRFGTIRSGASHEYNYVLRNLVLAKSVKSADGKAYAFAGNFDAFEGGPNMVGKTDGSTYDRARQTFFWAGMTITRNGSTTTPLYQMTRSDPYSANAANTADNKGSYDYLRWNNNTTTGYATSYDLNADGGANVRILKHDDFKDHRMWSNIYWHWENGSPHSNMHGIYYMLFLEDFDNTPTGPSKDYYWVKTVKTYNEIKGIYKSAAATSSTVTIEPVTQQLCYQSEPNLETEGGVYKALLPMVRTQTWNTSFNHGSEYSLKRQIMYGIYLPVPAGDTTSGNHYYSEHDVSESYVAVNPADADRINVEFSQDYVDGGAVFSVSYNGKLIDEGKVERRVYTYSYDYGKNVSVRVRFEDGPGADEVNYLPAQLERHVMTWGDEYYYIPKEQNGIVHGKGASVNGGSAGLIPGSFTTIYNGHALREDGAVIDVTDGSVIRNVTEGLVRLDEVMPMQTFNYGDIRVETYSRFSEFISDTLVMKDEQMLMAKNGVVGNVSGAMENVKDSLVLYNKDGEHEIILGTDGIMVNIWGMNKKGMEDIGAPEDFKNSGIVYMTNNMNCSQPFILVEYANRGSMVGYNYMTGEYLFNLYESNYVSLTDYVRKYFNGSVSKYADLYAGYAPNKELIDQTGSADRLANVVIGNSSAVNELGNSTGENTATATGGKHTEGETDRTDGNGEESDGYLAMFDQNLPGGVQDSVLLDGEQSGDGEGVLITEDMLKETEATNAPVPATDEDQDGYNNEEDGESRADGSNTRDEKGPGKDDREDEGISDIDGSSDADGSVTGAGSENITDGTEGGSDSQGTGEKSDEESPEKADAGSEQADADAADNADGADADDEQTEDEQDALSGKHVVVRRSTAGTAVGGSGSEGAKVPKNNINNGQKTQKPGTVKGEELDSEADETTVAEASTKLITVYNMSTGTFEIVDMRQYMTDANYHSENEKLKIQDLGAYAQEHGYAEKIAEKKRADGLLLYIAIALSVFAGTAGILMFRKKNKL